MKRSYNKLVRDNIPRLIEESKRECTYRIMDEMEYREALIDKIVEEMEEFRKTEKEEELADALEALDCLMRLKKFEPMHIEYIQLLKREARGSYNDKIMLISVEENASK